jgi:hypothetical protein
LLDSFVQTNMGNEAARLGGLEMARTTPEESSTKVLYVIGAATWENTAENFIDVMTGELCPWWIIL